MSSPKLKVNFRPKSEIQTFFPSKIRWSPKKKKGLQIVNFRCEIESEFSAEIGNSNVFSAQNQVVSKKKKVFTEIESCFSAEIVGFRLVGGMHPEMETDFSKWRLIFRPKSLLLGWWGGCIPPIPPLNPPLSQSLYDLPFRVFYFFIFFYFLWNLCSAFFNKGSNLNTNFWPFFKNVFWFICFIFDKLAPLSLL